MMERHEAWKARFGRGVAVALSGAALVLALSTPAATADDRHGANRAGWYTAWGTSQQVLGANVLNNVSVRMIARVTVPGTAIRIRLDNGYGTEPLVIGRAHVGLRTQGAGLVEGSNRPVTFGGQPGVTIPPGGRVMSDPVPMRVHAQQDLAVSLHVPGANVRPSQHSGARKTSYYTADGAGDTTADETADAFANTTVAMWWLKSIDVFSSKTEGTIVAFGDSITDGSCTTLDAHDRWEDLVAERIALDDENRDRRSRNDSYRAVVNEGIGGNTVTREGLSPPPDSTPGLERLHRDVLSHSGVRHVILFMGTNDIRREQTAENLIAGMRTIIRQVKARGIKIIGVTIIPRHNVPPSGTNTGWNDAKTAIRNEVNEWIRTQARFDAVIDFDKVVRDPANHDLIYPPYNCGDGIHPSPLGYFAMGRAVDLSIFESRRRHHGHRQHDHD